MAVRSKRLRGRVCAGIILLAVGAGCRCIAQGQDATNSLADDWLIRTWQTKDGLPQNTVNAIVQTRDGYLWVGTSSGLTRFDGARFRAFGLQDGLLSVRISSLLEDASGRLWVGTAGGGISRWENGRFITPAESDVLAGADVQALAAGREGTLWIGTEQGLLQWRDGAFARIGLAEGLPTGQVRALMMDSRGVLWVSMILEGLFQYSSNRFSRVLDGKSAPRGVHSLLEDGDGAIWAGGGGSLWKSRHGIWTRYTATNGLPGSIICSLAQGGDGRIWVGTRGSGLHVFKGGRFHSFNGEGISSEESVRGLMVDKEGTVWLGIPGGGLTRLTKKVLRNWEVAEGLPKSSVASVAEDSAGNLWAAIVNGGTYRLEDGHFSKLEDPPYAGNQPNPYSLLATGDGRVWSAGEQFLSGFKPGEPTRVFVDWPIRGEAIRAMCADGEALWLGTYYSTLLKFDGTNVQVAATNGSFGGNITCLVRETTDTIWIGTANGLYRWESGTLRAWTTKDGLLSGNITAIHRDEDGTVWAGTLGGGLSRLKNGRIVNITTRQGLVDDVVLQIVADDFGDLWLGSDRGIMCLARKELEDVAEGKAGFVYPAVFGQNEGMISEQCTGGHSPTALKTRNGRLLFPTARGVVDIDPRNWRDATAVDPRATIEEVVLDGQPQSRATSLVIPPGGRRLEINYTAPGLRGGEWVRFRTRLEPVDADWVNVGRRRTAFYPRLAPGHYVFHVNAGDGQGNWSQGRATLSVTVNPEFWLTWWFGGSVAAVVSVAAVAVYKRRTTALKTRHAEQEVVTRLIVHSQEDERKRVAAELHDGLSQNLALLAIEMEMLGQHPPETSGDLKTRLQALSTQTKGLSAEVHRISHGLHPAKLTQLGLAVAVRGFCREVEAAHRITLHFSANDVPRVLPEEVALCLYRVTQEAVQNVVKHSGAKSATVALTTAGDAIELEITDDGKGFDPNTHRGNGTLGLVTMSERVRLVRGQFLVESAPGEGTRVRIQVPVPRIEAK